MDLTEYYKLQTLTQFISMQFLKKVTQLVLSVSVFSFFFSHSSSLSFPQSFDFLSAFPFQLFGHTVDKNCIFLLFNGLLVLLAKYSGLIRSLSGSSHEVESITCVDHGLQPESSTLETTEAVLENKVMLETVGSAENVALRQRREIDYLIKDVKKETEKTAVEEGGESRFFISEEEEGEGVVYVSEDEEEPNESATSSFINKEEEEEEEDEGNEKLSTEELNKKFDDFIRRVKEEIRIEAQRQLVMV
ncbi:uncharacterized protein LOC121236712 [Juglans microcarpa x Juglans regia]|uniref:uncharacterized protein LOC121236712 n=1 Tax=Juglans microcarpa x Juglans regia TaxID=2249226 RepID=UPI001B7F48FC|nr:uncharacterized protein LOC121236712 [Juglans microcarpa x Juglans regia]